MIQFYIKIIHSYIKIKHSYIHSNIYIYIIALRCHSLIKTVYIHDIAFILRDLHSFIEMSYVK